MHSLTDEEGIKFIKYDEELDKWEENETKDMSAITGRKEPAKKAIKGLYYVAKNDFFNYIDAFINYEPKTSNRMKDAKAYGADPNTKLLSGKRLRDETIVEESKLRGFNAVIFEQNMKKIKESF